VTPHVILAYDARGNGVAIGPIRTQKRLDAVRAEVKAKPGWTYDDTLRLVSGADLKWQYQNPVPYGAKP
jgi:hypothetical protein